MDPITRASRVFLAEAEALWKEKPGRVLPLIAAPSERDDVVKALRLQEYAPENRRPLLLFEEPFDGPRVYFDGLEDAVRQDYEHIRRGVADDGVMLPSFPVPGESRPNAHCALMGAALAVEQAAMLLGAPFEGVLLALVPRRVVDARRWRESIATLGGARFSARVRIAVWAPPGGPLGYVLGEGGARLRIDRDELRRYLQHLGEGSGGAAGNLKVLLLDAGHASAAGEHAAAAVLYRQARAVYAAEGLKTQEAMVLIALGGACLGAGAPGLASESYTKAAELARAEEAWSIACQAWLGAGGAHLMSKEHVPAAAAYRAAAQAAEMAGVPVLRVESLRMAGTCCRSADPNLRPLDSKVHVLPQSG
jgi:hypothetical protein